MGNYKTYRVKKGKHDFKPDTFKLFWKPKGIHFTATFHPDCNYDLVDEDQKDWNKLVGITWSLNPLKETVMVGWRWDKKAKLMELNAYYHVNGRRIIGPVIGKVALGQQFSGEIVHDRKKGEYIVYIWSYSNQNSHKTKTKNRRRLARLINPWFGGNESAPKDMSLEMGFTKLK